MTDIQKSDEIEILVGLDAKTSAFVSLKEAVGFLVDLLRETEDKKLAAARVVQAIERQELYREAGCNSMKEFYPYLLEQTAAVGWNAERTVRNWVAFAGLYLDRMGLNERDALKANSHLHALYTLADIDRKTGELRFDTDNEKKVDGYTFRAIAEIVTALVARATPEQKSDGRDAEATRNFLLSSGIFERQLEVFEEAAGYAPFIPENGWAVAQTRQLIEDIRGEEEKAPKAKQIWYLSFQDEDRVEVERIAWEIDGEETRSVAWNTYLDREEFDAMSKGDKVIDGSEGEAE